MSDTGQKDRAYPRSTHDEVGAWLLGASCGGGKGGGNPYLVIGYPMKVIEFKVPKYDVYNRKLILFNESFDVYVNTGVPDPAYNPPIPAYYPGARVDWWLGFGTTDSLTAAQVMAQNIKITTAYPCEIEIDAADLPQPTDPGWANKIFIYMLWNDSNLLLSSHQVVNLEVIKHDYDIKI